MKLKDIIEIGQEWLNGKTLEYRYSNDYCWTVYSSTSEPNLSSHNIEWRIKPEPQVIYVNEYHSSDGSIERIIRCVHDSRQSAVNSYDNNMNGVCARKFVEVIE